MNKTHREFSFVFGKNILLCDILRITDNVICFLSVTTGCGELQQRTAVCKFMSDHSIKTQNHRWPIFDYESQRITCFKFEFNMSNSKVFRNLCPPDIFLYRDTPTKVGHLAIPELHRTDPDRSPGHRLKPGQGKGKFYTLQRELLQN